MATSWVAVTVPRPCIATATSKLRPLRIGLTAVMLVLAAVGSAADRAPPLRADDAWIRWLPANLPAAGYVTLRNLSNQPVALIGASTLDYAGAMFHESRNQHGVEKMLSVESIVIRPHAEVAFAPEGLHIMLMEPKRAIQPGDHVLVTLHFAGGQSLQVQFEVRKPDGTRAVAAAGSKGS
jgi:copper(I)-binding protein